MHSCSNRGEKIILKLSKNNQKNQQKILVFGNSVNVSVFDEHVGGNVDVGDDAEAMLVR